jgi:small-conductance mechanosensitive channel
VTVCLDPNSSASVRVSDPVSDPAIGRWATLKDAAGVLELAPEALLKQVRKGRRRGTRIGDNWFVYLDPDAEAAAAERRRLAAEKREVRRKALERLRRENEALREELGRLQGEPARGEGLGRRLAPLLDGIERQHRTMTAEIEFLRSELVATRQQHAEEMRRKDILIQQAHKTLQDVVRLGLPGPRSGAAPTPVPPPPAPTEGEDEMRRLREDQARISRVMGEMSELLTLMYRRLRRQDAP